jgi:hypothetical protein
MYTMCNIFSRQPQLLMIVEGAGHHPSSKTRGWAGADGRPPIAELMAQPPRYVPPLRRHTHALTIKPQTVGVCNLNDQIALLALASLSLGPSPSVLPTLCRVCIRAGGRE